MADSPKGVDRKTSFMLAPGEKDIYSDTFMPSLATPYMKTELLVSSTRFCYKAPNTLLGLIPLGSDENVVPIRNIASMSVSSKFFPLRAILGVILLFAGLGQFKASFLLALILVVLGILMLLMSFPGQLLIHNPAGGVTGITVSVLDKKKLALFANEAQNRIFADQEAIRHSEAQAMRMTQAQLAEMQLAQQQLANQMNMQQLQAMQDRQNRE